MRLILRHKNIERPFQLVNFVLALISKSMIYNVFVGYYNNVICAKLLIDKVDEWRIQLNINLRIRPSERTMKATIHFLAAFVLTIFLVNYTPGVIKSSAEALRSQAQGIMPIAMR